MVLSDGWAGWSGEAPPGPPLKAMPPELFFFIRTYTLLRGMASGLHSAPRAPSHPPSHLVDPVSPHNMSGIHAHRRTARREYSAKGQC